MNCQECQSYLHPYLDDEVGVDENLSISQHLEACPPCRDVFDDEKRCWSHFQGALRSERAPDSVIRGIDATLAAEDRRKSWNRVLRFGPAIAAAAAIVIALVIISSAGGPNDQQESPGGGPHPSHGPGVRFALASHGLHLAGRSIRDLKVLEKTGVRVEKLTGPRFKKFYDDLFGSTAELPAEFRDAVAATIPEGLNFKGTPVSNLMLDVTDVEVSIYRMSKQAAELANLKLVEDDGVPQSITIETCAACKVVAVTRGDEVYILVTDEGGVDPLIAIARQVF